MPDPTEYERDYSFTGWRSPTPLPGTSLDTELDNIADKTTEIVEAIKDIRAADGSLKNGIVDLDALNQDVLAALGWAALTAGYGGFRTQADAAAASIPAVYTRVIVASYSETSKPVPATYAATNILIWDAYPSRLKFTDAGGRYWVIDEEFVEQAHAGAVVDGVTDDTAAIDAMWAYFNIGDVGYDVRPSRGTSIYAGIATTSTVNITKSGRIFGYGKHVSIIKGTVGHNHFLYNPDLTGKEVYIDGVTWEGDWGGLLHTDTSLMNQRSNAASLLRLRQADVLSVTNCRFLWCRWINLIGQMSKRLIIEDTEFGNAARAGTNSSGCVSIKVNRNWFHHLDDDAVNAVNSTAGGEPSLYTLEAKDNLFHDVSGGLHLGSVQNFVITGNRGRGFRQHAIAIDGGGQFDSEYAPIKSGVIANNDFDTIIKSTNLGGTVRNNAEWISLRGRAPGGALGTDLVTDGAYQSGSVLWSYTGTMARYNTGTGTGFVAAKTAGGVGSVSQDLAFVAGSRYRLSFDVPDLTAGEVTVTVTGGTDSVAVGTFLDAGADQIVEFTALEGNTTLTFSGSDISAFWIDDVNCQEIITSTAPGQPDGAGDITPYYAALQNNAEISAIAPGAAVVISGNTLSTTFAETAAYSDWGFGLMWSKNGWIDPEITVDEIFSTVHTGIVLEGVKYGVTIADNNFLRVARPIQGNALVGGLRNVRISGGSMIDFRRALLLTGAARQDFVLDGVLIDGDPFHMSSLRGAVPNKGKWTAFTGRASLIDHAGTGGTMRNCHVRNVPQIFPNGARPTGFLELGNVAYCDPIAVGNNADNIGIRRVPTPGDGWRIVVEDGDPGSATFRTILNECLLEASVQPTTGKWVAGQFVRNTGLAVPANTGATLLRGWRRLTTGSAHATNVDWLPVFDTYLGALGPDLVTNGDMSSATGHTLGTDLSIAGGVLVAVGGAGAKQDTQAAPLTVGKTYRATFTVSGYSAGTVGARLTGGTTVAGTTRSANGTYTDDLVAVTGNTTISLLFSALGTMDVDNWSVRELL